jgi:four helix bundle protein
MKGLDRLDAFRLAQELAVEVYQASRRRPLSRHPILADQIARAAVSIPANIAEGYALGTKGQFVRGLRIAFGSTAELRVHLRIARQVGALAADRPSVRLAETVERMIALEVGLLKHYGAKVGRR